MQQDTRDTVQQEIKHAIQQYKAGVILVSVRVGKTLATLMSLKENQKVLVCYPRVKIKNGWISDHKKFKSKIASGLDITYTTYASLHKYKEGKYDVVVFDEVQKASARNLNDLKTIQKNKFVGLTGTLSYKTVNTLQSHNIPIVYKYTTEQAIADGLVKDYRITIKMVEPDQALKAIEEKYTFWINEQQNPDSKYSESTIGYRINRLMLDRKEAIYNNNLTVRYASQFLERNKGKKILCFTTRTDVADMLCDNSYHTKSKKEDEFEKFLESEGGHLSTVNCISEGVTIKNLNTVLFQSFDSNTENFQQKFGRSLLQEFTGEYSSIHVLCLKGTQQEVWLTKMIGDINKHKIQVQDGNTLVSYYDWVKAQHPGKAMFEYNNSICYESSKGNYTFLYGYKEYKLNSRYLKAI